MESAQKPFQTGDKVKVTIDKSSNLSSALEVKTGSLQVNGFIIEDRGENWLVELELSWQGKNRILVPKSAFR